MDLREITRRLKRLEAENRDLRALVGNLPDRLAPPPPPQRLEVDHNHDDDEHGTQVWETDLRDPGFLEDVWKVLDSPRTSRASSTTSAPNKVATSIAQHGGHDEGWVWGNVAYVWESGHEDEMGWGLWADIIGMEAEGHKYVNLMTWARWNNGFDGEGRKVGPIYFDDYEEDWSLAKDGHWLLGKMIFDGVWWRPSFRMPGETYVETRSVVSPATMPAEHGDHCDVFADPTRYVKLESFRVWTVGSTTGKTNVHKVAACNRDDINGIFRMLYVLDWHCGDIMGWHDNWLDLMFKSGGSSGPGGWIPSLWNLFQPWGARVTTILGDVTLTALWAFLNTEITNFLAAMPYSTKCPATPRDYEETALLKCKQIER